MENNTIRIEFSDGQSIEAILTGPFTPDNGFLTVEFKSSMEIKTLSTDTICCILMHESTYQEISKDQANVLADGDLLEEIETVSGKNFHVKVLPDSNYDSGFFAYSIESDFPFKVIYFMFDGIILRNDYSPVCEILKSKGLVKRKDIESALEQQKYLKSKRVGDILSEKHKIDSGNIEKLITQTRKKGMIASTPRIGDILISEGIVSKEQVHEALANQKIGQKKKIGELLLENGLLTEEQMLSALSTKFRMQFVMLSETIPEPEALKSLPLDLIKRFQIFPIRYNGERLVIATSSPADTSLFNLIRISANKKIELVIATTNDIQNAITKYYTPHNDIKDMISTTSDGFSIVEENMNEDEEDLSVVVETDSTIIRMARMLLTDAYEKKASDIHFEPGPGRNPLLVRYRMEGECYVAHSIPEMYKRPLISRIKILSGLDIAERRKPQSGKILLYINQRKVEYRVEITPTVGANEDAVLRILSSSKPMPLDKMDFSPRNIENFKKMLKKPYGIILCVGPTGSGKTTALHSALGEINTPNRKIWTVEDPVEITQSGLRQVQVNPKIGFTFKEALKSFLRADPDIIMIGEMRDSETAKIAVEASLTGHLVFSTLHTNSAPETIVRLIEMGIDPINFSDALLGILAQRLTGRLCEKCKQSYHPTREEYDEIVNAYGTTWYKKHDMPPYADDFTLMKKTGCPLCNGTGYKGRIAIHELLIGTDQVKKATRRQEPTSNIENLMLKDQIKMLKMDGIEKVFQGLTDLNQVLRVCM